MFEFGNFAAPGDRGLALLEERAIHHSLDDNGAGGVICAGFGSEPEEFDP